MNLYLDASALVKRYVAEPGSEIVRDAMADADAWFMCRIGFVETHRAIGMAAGGRVAQRLVAEWPAFGSIEVDATLAEAAAGLAVASGLHTLDALHLAAALVLPREELVLAAWHERLRAAARERGLRVLPESLAKSGSPVKHVLRTLRLRDRVQAVIYAYERGLARPAPRG